jgi:TPR repeat protein
LTGLTLTFAERTAGGQTGTFEFFPLPTNPHAKKGSYEIFAKPDNNGGIIIKTGRWLDRPSGYYPVGLRGTIDETGLKFRGQVIYRGCSAFSVVREVASNTNVAHEQKFDTREHSDDSDPRDKGTAAPKVVPSEQHASSEVASDLNLPTKIPPAALAAETYSAEGSGAFFDVEKLRSKAENGDANAMFVLGRRLEIGVGIAKDQNASMNWYRKAADAGSARAMTTLAMHLDEGRRRRLIGIAKAPRRATLMQ